MRKKIILLDWLKLFLLFVGISYIAGGINAQDLNPSQWPHLKGYWKYQNVNNLTKATVGKDLLLTGTHQVVNGPAVGDTAIRIAIGSYYSCRHGMAPNGGGDSVNRYTLMFDFKVLSFKKWHTFFKSDSNNNNDGECFIRPITGSNPGRIGVAATGYSKDSINPNQWYRLMISVNLNNFYRYYLNGKLLHEGDTQDVDGRFALTPKMIFFGDDNQEDDTIDVASVAVFDTCLSAADIAKIGSIDPCVANPPKFSLGRDTVMCDYNSIVKSPGAGFKKYQWSTGSSLASVTLTKSIGYIKKNIWCKVTDVNGCIVADTFALTFVPPPVVNLGANQAFCQGISTKLLAGTDTTYQYLWKFLPAGNTLSTKNNLTTDSGGQYMVTVTNKTGCFSRDTILITVYKHPAKPAVSITGSTSFCQGQSVVLDGPNGFFAYHWNNGLNQQTISVSKSDTLRLKVTDNNNCSSFYSDSIVVKVFALPVNPKIQVTGNTTFCQDDSVILNLPAGFKEYVWQDKTINTPFRYVKAGGLYYGSIRDSNNCKSANSDSVMVKVNPLPIPAIIQLTGKPEICKGEFTTITAPSGYKRYWWSSGRGTTRIDSVYKTGSYYLQVEDANGCISKRSNSVNVTVYPLPIKPAVVKAGTDVLQSDITALGYRWYRNAVVMQDTQRVITSAPSGYYQVQIKDSWCWSPLSDSFLYTNSSIVTIAGPSPELLIYPNPANTEVTIRLQGELQGDATIVLTDMKGREVYRLNLSAIIMGAGTTMDLRQLASGIYQLKVLTSKGTMNGKIEKL